VVQRLDLRIRLGDLTRGHASSSLSGPKMSLYARVRGTRRRWATRTRRRSRRPVSRATARRIARATRPIRSAIVVSVARTDGPFGGRRSERVSKSEHDAVEINRPDDRLDRPGIPVRGEEIDSPSRAFRELLREADFGPPGLTSIRGSRSRWPARVSRTIGNRPASRAWRRSSVACRLADWPLASPGNMVAGHIAGIVPATNPHIRWQLAAALSLR
jgi:hypothetical protein